MDSQILTGLTEQHLTWLSPQLAIHQQALLAWQAMQQHAQKDGIALAIASGFRSFERQQRIWNNKVSGKTPIYQLDGSQFIANQHDKLQTVFAILLYSALPGASRHHWGTDIDVYATNLLPEHQALQLSPEEYSEQGYFAPLSAWLAEHAHRYDFFFPYDQYRQGVAPEPWHLSYAPVAQQLQQQLSCELLTEVLQQQAFLAKQTVIKHLTEIYQQFIINIGAYPHD